MSERAYVVTNARGVGTIIAAFRHKGDAYKYLQYLGTTIMPTINTYVAEVEISQDWKELVVQHEETETGQKRGGD